ncbi:MAG TPA: cellulose synthase catalytic subunit [Alphaproteobacteria bacterium]|nr:cellulose synthase catalytic subunit [Alphaproteobacteria bacterium]
MTQSVKAIKKQGTPYQLFYLLFAAVGFALIIVYLSNTIIHYTTNQQFPINSFERFPLSYLIFPVEIFSFLFSIYFVYNLIKGNTVDSTPQLLPDRDSEHNKVAILIPVFNEPKEIVQRTLAACKALKWKAGVQIYLLDDSNTTEDKNNMKSLAKKFDAVLVTRPDRIGYKAGNLNHAVKHHVKENYFVIFDSDQAPLPEFLEETMDHFSDPQVGFIQTPQHFINTDTAIERAQQLGNNIFYQAQCVSKADDKAMPFCGTNVIVRTDVFKLVKGFSHYTATEDIEVGLRINEAGYHGAYVPKVLVHGYATSDYNSYSSQQYRWANGNLAILRKNWHKILFGKFSLRQQIHTIFTLGWWIIGVVSLIYIAVPILSFFFGGTHHTWLPSLMLGLLFLNVVMGISMIYVALKNRLDEDKVTLKDAFLQYSLITNSMFIYARAAFNALILGRYVGFVRTNKKVEHTGISQVRWNILLAIICFGFSVFALFKSITAGSVEQLRSYLPIAIWLMFYTLILSSSILFVGDPAPESELSPADHRAKTSNQALASQAQSAKRGVIRQSI